jgi:superfamily II DNA/RNA helicase
MQNDFLAVSLRSNMLVLNARDEFDGEPLVDFPAAVNHVLRHGMSDEEGKVQEYTRISWDSNYKAEQKRRKYQDLPYVESLDDFERLPAWGRSRQGLVHYLLADEKYTPTAKATPEKRKALDDHQKEMIGMLTGELFWDATTEDDTTISPGKAECDKMLAKDIRAKWRESTRIQTLLSSLEERLMDMSRKVLIFDESARVLNVVGIALEESGLNYYYIHGGVAKDERTKLLAEFSNSKKQDPVRIFLITTKCGGVGLDQLKVADTVYIMTPSHNPFLEAQCIARASRMGNNKEVNVFRFFTPDSIEERISHIQDEKKLKASNLFDPRKASNEGIKKMMKWESGKDFLEMVSTTERINVDPTYQTNVVQLKSMSDDEEPRRPRAKKEDQRRPKSSDEDEDEEGKATSQPSRSMSPRTHEHTDSGPPSPRDSDDASNSEGHENLDQNREPSPPIFEQSTESNLTSPRDSNDDGNGVHTTNDDVGSEVEDLPSNEALNFEALFTTHDQRSNTSNPSHPRYPQRDGLGFSNQLASPFLVPSTNPSQTHAWNQRHIFQFPPALRPWEHGQFPGTEDYVNFGPMNGGYRNSVEPAPDNLLGFMDEPGFPTHTEMIGGSVQEDYDLMGDWKMEETDNDRALRMIREEGRDARRARGGR